MTDSCGSRSNNARATVSPPIPESKTPSGALFMDRDGDADAAGKRPDLEIGGEVAEMGRYVGLRAREEMIEHPEHEPVLHFLPLEPQVLRVNFLEVVRFLLRLQRHHGGNTFPRHEHGARHRPAGGRLAPAGKHEGAQERPHGPDAVVHGICWEGHVARISGLGGILSRKMERWNDGEKSRQGDHSPSFPHSIVLHRATKTFSLRRSNFTVHALTPGSRSSPSMCSTSGPCGERITSVAVLMSATSRMVRCVPRMTRGIAMRKRGSDTRRIRHTSILPSAGSASGANR